MVPSYVDVEPRLAAGLCFCRDTVAARRSLTTRCPRPRSGRVSGHAGESGHQPSSRWVVSQRRLPASRRRSRRGWATTATVVVAGVGTPTRLKAQKTRQLTPRVGAASGDGAQAAVARRGGRRSASAPTAPAPRLSARRRSHATSSLRELGDAVRQEHDSAVQSEHKQSTLAAVWVLVCARTNPMGTRGYVVVLEAPSMRGGRPTRASHDSRPRTLPPQRADGAKSPGNAGPGLVVRVRSATQTQGSAHLDAPGRLMRPVGAPRGRTTVDPGCFRRL